MPTNIIRGAADPVGGNAWQTVGQGAQGLAALVGSALSARAAQKAQGQQTLTDAGYKAPGMGDLQMSAPGGVAANPFQGPDMMPSRPVGGMVQPFESNPSGPFMSVGPSAQPPDLMKSLQYGSPGGVASVLPIHFPKLFQSQQGSYGGL